ncbi:putative transcription factor tfiiic complex subunit tfc6 [Phaeomoniella chlamydospora]|uniref:Putative transcription factor tfiiic complex subunit tfc6 n=1 Tax=Phaeomoniella chlamydospora TaxID=158046 RepID=A0A0G2F1Z2_PHACM|nr:putative transcription factor tfiiic complex subunit tfc6 [Phaeomoniella chlamydospora]
MDSIRRSGRSRKVNTRYTDDILDEEVKRILAPASGSSSSDSGEPPTVASLQSSESEFDVNLVTAEVDVGDDDDTDVSASDGPHETLEESDIQTPAESDDDIMSVATDYDSDGRPGKTRRVRMKQHVEERELHYRGVAEILATHSGKEEGWNLQYGPADVDMLPIIYTRDLWLDSPNATIPWRKTLQRAIRQGPYGKAYRFGLSEDMLKEEATRGWDWFYREKGARFIKRQECRPLHHLSQQRKYLPQPSPHNVVLGPLQQQQIYKMTDQQCIGIGATGKPKSSTSPSAMDIESRAEADENQEAPTVIPARTSPDRAAWLLNTGTKVQCLSWAPNANSSTQYLAIACATTSSQRRGFETQTTAITSSPPYPSNIQIWAIAGTNAAETPLKLDMSTRPKLIQVLCTNWGDIRQLIWCPMLREPRAEDAEKGECIGLLACSCGDGSVRVLHINHQAPTSSDTKYFEVHSSSFSAIPPEGSPIYTSAEWLSPTDLAISNAFGSVSLFSIVSQANLPDSMKKDPDSARPYYVLPIPPVSTYIIAMSYCYPSVTPGLMALTSAGGETILFSLAQSHVETVNAPKLRRAGTGLSYIPTIRGHLLSQEDCLYYYATRRFFSGHTVGRAVASGSITCHAVSRWHPFVIFGTSGGDVITSSVLRRVLPGGRKYGGSGHWQQRVVKYDWIPEENIGASAAGKQAVENDPGEPDVLHVKDARLGRSRFYEGFYPERIEMTRSATDRLTGKGAKRTGTAAQRPTDIGMETIFEEENAATAVAWNSNLKCAGWAAMGFGSGIVRIEDLTWE